jgi:alpha-L-fucosidase
MKNIESLQCWQEARFGMFLHFGVYSLAAGEWRGARTTEEGPWKGKPFTEFMMLQARIPIAEYEAFARDFCPDQFDADHWVRTAKDAGMRYVVFTAKHHDGFAMYDSLCDAFNIVRHTRFKRDPLRELSDACKRHGLRFEIYYSLGRDWHDPDVPTLWPTKGARSNAWDFPNEDAKDFERYFSRKVMPQMRELLTGYGTVDIMWFDTPEMITAEQSRRLRVLINHHQPACIVNDRIAHGFGDYETTEQQFPSAIKTGPWEACITMSRNWCYSRHDHQWKSAELLVRHLADVVAKGGNLLLNVNPKPDGTFPAEATERLAAIGEWLRVNGEAITGTHVWHELGESLEELVPVAVAQEGLDTIKDETSKSLAPDLRYTAKADALYLIARSWREESITTRTVAEAPRKVRVNGVQVLGSDEPTPWKTDGDGLHLRLPLNRPAGLPLWVVKVSLSAEPQPVTSST